MKRIYLDYASTTPVDPRVFAAMRPYFGERFGNPGSLHSFGQEAQSALDAARESVAARLGAEFREIIFTGSATEANNLALRGALKGHARGYSQSGIANRVGQAGRKTLDPKPYWLNPPRIIVSAVEHESVLATAKGLEKEGIELRILPVNREGVVETKKLKELLDERTALVSVMRANNETGAIQPVSEIGRVVSEFRSELHRSKTYNLKPDTYPLFHTDAAQAFQFLDCSLSASGVDLLTLSAHKIYGPKGVGMLYAGYSQSGMANRAGQAERKTPNPKPYWLNPILTGGGQEFGLRSGTENVPLIAGLAKAAELAAGEREKTAKRLIKLQKELWLGIKRALPSARLNGPALGKKRLPNNVNVYLPGFPADKILTMLDMEGIAASSGSACASRSAAPSHVLLAMGLGEKRARQSVRFSLGRMTTAAEIRAANAVLRKVFCRLQ